MSPETRAKISAARRGQKLKPMTAEHKARIGAAQREAWVGRKIRLGRSGGCQNNRIHRKEA